MDKDGKELELSMNGVKRIGHEHSDRIRDDAVLRVMYEEQNRISKVFRAAKVIAESAGRKTVIEEDVRIVYQLMEELPDA